MLQTVILSAFKKALYTSGSGNYSKKLLARKLTRKQAMESCYKTFWETATYEVT